MSGGIFVSYRREDAKHAAGRLVDRLVAAVGRDKLFMDVDNIEPGLDFVKVLNDQVARADVLLALIGPNWLDARDPRGVRRLDNPDDFVRIEIEAALARDIRIVPVLLDGAQMPGADALPSSLHALARRQAVRISHERFAAEADGLAGSLKRALSVADPAPAPEKKRAFLQDAYANAFKHVAPSPRSGPPGNSPVAAEPFARPAAPPTRNPTGRSIGRQYSL